MSDSTATRYRITRRGGKEWKQRLCSGWKNTCRALAMRGKTKCKNCGGKTPRGAASTHTKTGKYSKELLILFRERAEHFLNNRDKKELARLIAYAKTLVEDSVERLCTFESGAA